MAASPEGISWLNQHICRPLSQPSSDRASQWTWSIRSASSDGGNPSPSGQSTRSWLTMAARARRSRSLALTGVLMAILSSPTDLTLRRAAQVRASVERRIANGRVARPHSLVTDRYQPRETVMNPIRRFRRFAAALAGLAGGLLSFAVAAPTAFARPAPPLGQPFRPGKPLPPGWDKHPPLPPTHVHQVVHTVVVGGMPGWQIALIAAAAA